MSVSVSVSLRQQGNSFYTKTQADLPPVVRKERLQKAISLYFRALDSSSNEEETSSAAKNHALASWNLALLLLEQNDKNSLIQFNFQEAVKYFDIALGKGGKVKTSSWTDEVRNKYCACVIDFLSFATDLPREKRPGAIELVINKMVCDECMKAICFLKMAEILFHDGVVSISNGDFKSALNSMAECYRPIEEVKRLGRGKKDLLQEVKVLEEDVYVHKCVAESMQARVAGDLQLETLLKDEEELNMTSVFVTLDWYRNAVVLTREKEVEMEAIALSRLGVIYDSVLKLRFKAKEYFMRCMELAHSMEPRNFHTEDWYKACSVALEKYQQEQKSRDEAEKQKARAKYVEELKDELKKLKELAYKKKSDIDFLEQLYKEFPPKNEAHKWEPQKAQLSVSERKKVVTKVLLHYHPDKQDTETHGMKWKVLCEEITKELTRIYECLKG